MDESTFRNSTVNELKVSSHKHHQVYLPDAMGGGENPSGFNEGSGTHVGHLGLIVESRLFHKVKGHQPGVLTSLHGLAIYNSLQN